MTEQSDPHVVITETDGTVTSFLLNPARPILKNPITGLGQVVTTGDTAERADQRTPQVIATDQSGGMGEFFYTETQGLATFTDSECDTRFPGLICLVPAATVLGATGALGALSGVWHVEYVNETNATRIAWSPGATSWRYTGSAWTQTSMPTGNCSCFFIFNGTYYLGTVDGLWYSTNGTAWTAILFPPDSSVAGGVVHDNKVYVVTGTFLSLTLNVSTNGTTFSSIRVVQLNPGEKLVQLQEWRDRVGRAVIYLFSNQRLRQYDEDADQFLTFYQFTRRSAAASATGWFEPWQRDGNGYVVLGSAARPDSVYWFSGTTNRYAPNLKGGLPNASRMTLLHHRGGDNWLYFWGGTRASPATATGGRTLAMNDQGGFHTLVVGTPTTNVVVGGGYDEGLLWTVTNAGTVYEQAVPDTTDSPLYVTAGERTYVTGGPYNHEYAFTDGGTPNLAKQARWVTVQCLDHTSANKVPGLAANTSVVVQYRRDIDTSWTTLGTLTSANTTWPMVLPIGSGNGVSFKQLKIRLQLSSTSANTTPIVTSVALAYTRSEVPRYGYTFDIIVPDPAHPLYAGKDVAQQLAALDRYTQPGATVQVQFAGGDWATPQPTGTTIANAVISYSGQLHPTTGPLAFQMLASDFTPPASG